MIWRFLAPYSTSIPCPPTPPRFLAPYSTSAYIRVPRPPPWSHPRNPNLYLSFRSTHTRRIRSRTLQCSRLVAREWGSSWAHAQVLDLVLKARQSLVSSLLHLVRLIINLSYSYLHGYVYFEYISFLVKGYQYFCVQVHRALSLLVYRLG